MQKRDIYKDHGYIAIRHTMAPVQGGEATKEVKQKKERRIPFYDEMDSILKDAVPTVSELVFVNPNTGKPYSKNINRDIWNPACKKAGVSIDLNNAGRHSWGNQMAEKGIDFEIIAKGLGHSTTAITKAHYADPSMSVLKEAVDGNKVVRLEKKAHK